MVRGLAPEDRHRRHPMLRRTAARSLGPLAAGVLLVALPSHATGSAGRLDYFKNYFVTGDYVAAGVGLRGTGINGFATGTISLTGVPCTSGAAYVPCFDAQGQPTPGAVPADVVAAFLYWETEETATNPSAANGFFDG